MDKQEMRFIRRELINKYLQSGALLCSIKEQVRFDERHDFGYELIAYSPFEGWDFGGGIDDPRY